MRGLKFKVCKLVPYMPYQKCTNISCISFKGCCYISPIEKSVEGYNRERLKMLRSFEMYKAACIKVNNSTLNEGASPDDLE